jgi:hypothetical protein
VSSRALSARQALEQEVVQAEREVESGVAVPGAFGIEDHRQRRADQDVLGADVAVHQRQLGGQCGLGQSARACRAHVAGACGWSRSGRVRAGSGRRYVVGRELLAQRIIAGRARHAAGPGCWPPVRPSCSLGSGLAAARLSRPGTTATRPGSPSRRRPAPRHAPLAGGTTPGRVSWAKADPVPFMGVACHRRLPVAGHLEPGQRGLDTQAAAGQVEPPDVGRDTAGQCGPAQQCARVRPGPGGGRTLAARPTVVANPVIAWLPPAPRCPRKVPGCVPRYAAAGCICRPCWRCAANRS